MPEGRHAEDEGIPQFDEEVPERPSDDDQEIPFPSDRPRIADDRLTPAEQREREPIADRIDREEPDVDEQEEQRSTPGRLVEETPDGRDVTRELEADETGDQAGLAAEEAAVTLRDADEQMPDDPSTDQVTGEGAAATTAAGPARSLARD